MSTLIVDITPVKDIRPHPNADKLELATIKGWSVVVQKDVLKKGDLVVYIPPDAILPAQLHQHLDITKYCAELPKSMNTDARRVKAARLRGEASYGTIMTLKSFYDYQQIRYGYNTKYPEGTNVAAILAITKWEPPVKATQGDVMKNNPSFPKYTSIEHWGNYPDVFEEDEEIVITEKIHGTNCRLGIALDADPDTGQQVPTFMAGSHNTRRKPEDANGNETLYWLPFKYPPMKEMLADLFTLYQKPVVVYGEIYGEGIQDMGYEGPKAFAVFDMTIGGKYIMWDNVKALCQQYNIPVVPELYRGAYSADKVRELTDGPTEVCEDPKGNFKGREGVVVKPVIDRNDPVLGRVILKSVSADYLARRGGTDSQ